MATNEEIQKAADTPGTDALPAAGHGRREALLLRQARLDREIEERSEAIFIDAIDPAKFRSVDNEIAAFAMDGSDVPNQRADYAYCWVEWNERLPSDHGQHVEAAQFRGFEFVRKSDVEFKGLDRCRVTPEGYIRWGSTLLMRCPRDRFVQFQAMLRAQQKIRAGEHLQPTRIVELGEKYGVKVHTELSPEAIARARQQYDIQQRQQQAWKRIDRRLRDGLPGHFPAH